MDGLLRGRVAGNDEVLGRLRIPRAHFEEFAEAERYLARDPEAVAILYTLEHGRRALRLSIIRDGNDRFDGADTIAWDPHSALRTTQGGRQTPALGLLHEEDHAFERLTAPRLQKRLLASPDPAYDDLEEKRVIAGVETRAAKILGEGVRTDHRGTLFTVSKPTSL
jgi:hypothetical protein